MVNEDAVRLEIFAALEGEGADESMIYSYICIFMLVVENRILRCDSCRAIPLADKVRIRPHL